MPKIITFNKVHFIFDKISKFFTTSNIQSKSKFSQLSKECPLQWVSPN